MTGAVSRRLFPDFHREPLLPAHPLCFFYSSSAFCCVSCFSPFTYLAYQAR
jgi:hypothetical protein